MLFPLPNELFFILSGLAQFTDWKNLPTPPEWINHPFSVKLIGLVLFLSGYKNVSLLCYPSP